MPDEDLSWHDLVRGTTTFAAGTVPDFALTRASGDPLYTLVNPVDDALMKITHVLRGEDLLSSTPRQIALYQALIRIGVADRVPEFAHLPTVLGEGTKKLSKRDPQSNLFLHRDRGFIPEGSAQLSGAAGLGDRRRPRRLQPRRDGRRVRRRRRQLQPGAVRPEEGRRDQRRAHPPARRGRLRRAGCATTSMPTATTPGSTTRSSPWPRELVQTRIVVLCDAWELLKFLNDDAYELDPKAAAKELGPDAAPVLDAAITALDGVTDWTTPAIEDALKAALIDGLELKPRKAFGPIRVAATGATISPPLFESLELLGRDRSLQRLRGARDHAGVLEKDG